MPMRMSILAAGLRAFIDSKTLAIFLRMRGAKKAPKSVI
jgi:hypothetical protein